MDRLIGLGLADWQWLGGLAMDWRIGKGLADWQCIGNGLAMELRLADWQ